MERFLNKSLAVQDLRELQAFSAILHFGSLTSAAKHLDLPKSTLSRRITQLEERLGQRLLRREGHRIQATEAGIEFANYCEQILSVAFASEQSMDTLKEEIRGELHFAFHSAFTRGWLINAIDDFLKRYSQVKFKIRTAFSCPVALPGEEICIWVGETGKTDLRQELVGHLTQGIYSSPAYLEKQSAPTHPRDLVHYRWINTLSESNEQVSLFHPTEEQFLLPVSPSLIQFDQIILQADAISRGNGLGFFPNWLAEKRIEAHPGSLERCLPEWNGPKLPVSLLYPHGHISKRSRAFLKHLRAAIPEAIRQA